MLISACFQLPDQPRAIVAGVVVIVILIRPHTERVAIGNAGIPAARTGRMEPGLFQHVKLTRTLTSWSNVIHSRVNKDMVMYVVHGALLHYDLPNLAAVLGNKLTVEQPANAIGAVIEEPKK